MMTRLANSTVKPSITNSKFVGRIDVINEIINRIEFANQSMLLVGLRRIGKTALLSHIYEKSQSTNKFNFDFVYVDAQRFSFHENYSFSFWNEILDLVRKKYSIKGKSGLATDSYQELLRLIEAHKKRIVILIDNFDAYIAVADKSDVRKIRGIIDSPMKKHITFVATTSEEPTKTIERNPKLTLDESPFYDFISLHLLPFTLDEVNKFVYQTGFDLNEAQIQFAYDISGGHPELLIFMLEYISEVITSGPSISLGEQERIVRRNMLIDQRVILLCKSLFMQLLPSDIELINAVIVSNGILSPEKQNDPGIYKLISHSGILRKENNRLKVFTELFLEVNKELLRLKRTTSTKFREENVAYTEIVANDQQSTTFEYDQKQRVLVINGKTIKLSKLQNKLFAYLFSHRGQVCTKEELLQNLWPPKRSTKVLERAINRLRNDIEEDPTTPKLILTERGQGYQLNLN